MFLSSSPLCFIQLPLLDPVDPPALRGLLRGFQGVHGQLASIDPNLEVFAVESLDVSNFRGATGWGPQDN